MRRRVVVTGIGMVSPLGKTVSDSWRNLLAGKSGVTRISSFDPSDFSCQIAATVKDFEPTDYFSAKEAKKMDVFIQYGIVAAIEAIENSGITVTEENGHRIGIAIGSGIGGLSCIEQNHLTYIERGAKKISPFFIPATIINMISGNLAIKYGMRGPNIALVSACTTGTHNIGYAARTIAYGDADIMVAGGSEKASTPMGIGGFAALKALSTRNDEPQKASRPFDKDRDGFVLGDGAGVVVLEEYESAKARGARIYGEVKGFGVSDDAYHMTMPAEGGRGAYECMQNALRDAQIEAEAIDYINAHGTSTAANDKLETMAIKRVFASHAYKLAVSSTKSMTGHTLGAAGAIEAIFSLLSLNQQVIPPTINLDNPDLECDLDYVPHEAREAKINAVLSNSFGFGGTNGSLVFTKI